MTYQPIYGVSYDSRFNTHAALRFRENLSMKNIIAPHVFFATVISSTIKESTLADKAELEVVFTNVQRPW